MGDFLDWVNGDGKTHPKCGHPHSMGWGPGLANSEKANRVPAFIALWFLLQRHCDQLSPALAAMPSPP